MQPSKKTFDNNHTKNNTMQKSKIINTIPVFVDDIKNYENFKFTRLTYFYLDLSEPEEAQLLLALSLKLITIIGNEGIIMSGVGKNKFLDNPEIIDELFDYIEDNTPFVVNTGYFWLPNSIITKYITEKLNRQSVLRIQRPLLIAAIRNLSDPERIKLIDLPADVPAISISSKETEAFKNWTDLTIDQVKKRYYQNKENNLRFRTLK